MLWGKMNVDWQQRIDFDRLRRDRLARAHRMLNKHGIGAAIIYNWDSQRYVSSVFTHPYHRHIPIHFYLLIRDKGFPLVWGWKGVDDERTKEDAPWLADRIVTDDTLFQTGIIRMVDTPEAEKAWARTAHDVKNLLKENGVAELPVSIDYSSPYLVHALEKEGLKVVDGNAWMMEARMVKTDDEINVMHMAASCNEAGYGLLVRELRPGMRENDAQAIMARAIYETGAEYIEGWVTNSGPRTSPRSFNWSDRTIRPGELFSIEACHVTFCGYKVCCDRTFVVGDKPTEIQKAIYQLAVEMHYKAQELLKPGITSIDVAKTRPKPDERNFRNIEEVRNYKTGWHNHFGGIGMGWWEPPVCMLDEPEVVLERNMIVAYHPVFHVKDGEGVAIENTYRITDTGCELMTRWPWEELTRIA